VGALRRTRGRVTGRPGRPRRQNDDTIEHAQQIANHESPRTTKLYDRTNHAISLDQKEQILI
jgi:5-methylcytosine-specific restriction endonuclease McrA